VNAIVDIPMQPIALGDVVADSPKALAELILADSNNQVEAKGLADADVRSEFLLSCDALNYARVAWRCAVEWGHGTRGLDDNIGQRIRELICDKRGYEGDDFDSARQAVSRRVRLPYGWSAIDYAHRLAQKEPIRLLQPDLAGKKLPTLIANIAYQLSLIQDKDPILLPIDQLRAFLQQRKIVVSGVVQRLVEAGVLRFQDRNYRTGKAREFRFVGQPGEHFEIEKPPEGPF
jgi:hypothetical protein